MLWRIIIMATNLGIDDTLLTKALKIGGYKSKKDTVNAALDEFIKRRKAKDLIDIFGTIEYDNSYNYKKMRSR